MTKLLSFLVATIILLITTVVPVRYVHLLQKEAFRPISEAGVSQLSVEKFVIKIPIALPYATEWEEPKAAEGLFERNGEFYTVISKNYKNDTLYIECYQNNNAKEVFNLLADHLENYSDFSSEKSKGQSHGQSIVKLLTQHYYPISRTIFGFLPDSFLLAKAGKFKHTFIYSSPCLLLESPPPRPFIS